jgi:hypothetical protein
LKISVIFAHLISLKERPKRISSDKVTAEVEELAILTTVLSTAASKLLNPEVSNISKL